MTSEDKDLDYRERKVLKGLMEGRSNAGIGRREGISGKTVEDIIGRLAKKLAPETKDRREFNVRTRVIYKAIQKGLV